MWCGVVCGLGWGVQWGVVSWGSVQQKSEQNALQGHCHRRCDKRSRLWNCAGGSFDFLCTQRHTRLLIDRSPPSSDTPQPAAQSLCSVLSVNPPPPLPIAPPQPPFTSTCSPSPTSSPFCSPFSGPNLQCRVREVGHKQREGEALGERTPPFASGRLYCTASSCSATATAACGRLRRGTIAAGCRSSGLPATPPGPGQGVRKGQGRQRRGVGLRGVAHGDDGVLRGVVLHLQHRKPCLARMSLGARSTALRAVMTRRTRRLKETSVSSGGPCRGGWPDPLLETARRDLILRGISMLVLVLAFPLLSGSAIAAGSSSGAEASATGAPPERLVARALGCGCDGAAVARVASAGEGGARPLPSVALVDVHDMDRGARGSWAPSPDGAAARGVGVAAVAPEAPMFPQTCCTRDSNRPVAGETSAAAAAGRPADHTGLLRLDIGRERDGGEAPTLERRNPPDFAGLHGTGALEGLGASPTRWGSCPRP